MEPRRKLSALEQLFLVLDDQARSQRNCSRETIFQKQACVTCRLSNVEPIHARIETLKGKTFEVVTSRAFASLKDMVELTRDILSEDGRWLAMKGKFPDQEIAELPSDIEVEKKLLLTLGNGKIERVLIVLKRKNAQ